MFKQKIPTHWLILACLGACTILFAAGCAGKKTVSALSLWPAAAITADGHDADWPETPPLYYDTENRLAIRAMNNSQTLYVVASIASKPVQASLARGGISLSLIPEQNPEHPFTILVKGKGGHQRPKPNREKEESKTDSSRKIPGFAMADTLTITYPHGSNPMDMGLEEAKKTGITIALKENADRMVIEAAIHFDAISSLEEFAPDRRVTLVLSSGQDRNDKSSDSRSSGKGGGGGPGGGGGKGGGGGPGGGGPGGSGQGKKEAVSSFDARLNLVLAKGPA